MRITTLSVTLLFLLSVPVTSQTMNEELGTLRELLSVPESTSITLATSSSLPETTPLKVFVAVGLDLAVRDHFIIWIDKWNKGDGKKYGTVEIATDMLLVYSTEFSRIISSIHISFAHDVMKVRMIES